MPLFTDKIELAMADSRRHLIEKFVFDVKKRNIQIKVRSGYEAIVNGSERIGPNETANYSKQGMGDQVTAFVYQKGVTNKPVIIPFFAGQHTISLDQQKTAKVTFAVVGNAKIEVSSMKGIARYFDNTVDYEDLERELINKVRDTLSTSMTQAAKTYINSSSTDVTIANDLTKIARAGINNSALLNTLSDMGLMLDCSGVALRLNPIGDSENIINAINARYNQAAMEEFDEAKENKKRQWDREDKMLDNQHEIDVINAENTNTKNNNNSNTYNFNGGVPNFIPGQQGAPSTRYCSNCGRELAQKDKFCPGCGHKVK